MIIRNILLLILSIYNITNSFYINGECCNSCRGGGTSKGEINNNNQSKQKNKNTRPTSNPLSKIIPDNIIPIPNDQYSDNPTNPDNTINEQSNNNNVQEPKNETVTPGLKGLQNVGATCYMNAVLQCFSNLPRFRTELLVRYQDLKQNKDEKYKLSFALAEVLQNLWSKNGGKYYSPNNFKDTIGELNHSFKGIAANDPKDLVIFIMQQIHKELNTKESTIATNNNNDRYDFLTEYNSFMDHYNGHNDSIMTNEFHFYTNNMTTCSNCKKTIHSVQTDNILFFPLEEVRKFKGYNNNSVSINDCFEYYERQTYSDYTCNNCNYNCYGNNSTKIVSSAKTLIINLNRGHGIEFDVNITFEEYLYIDKFVYMPNSPKNYELTGVICHIGTNDDGGHFIAYCKNSNNCKWYKFNDTFVIECPFKEVQEKGLPYVLFYSYVEAG